MNLQIVKPTTLRKGRDGWQAETLYRDPATGKGASLSTWKNSRGGIYSSFQFGEVSADGFNFSFVVFQDKRGTLCEDRKTRCTEKSISEMHTKAVTLFNEQFKDSLQPE